MGWRILAVVTALLAAGTSAGAVTDENFQLRSGADLVALCGVAKDDPMRSLALQMCEGYCVGVYQTILALTTHQGLQPLFCPPDPPPSRNEAIAQFVEWSKDKTQYQGDRPVDFVGRFLVERFPCPKDAKPTRHDSK
jgi:Ssp1 endopeptidase immunity protein Rap1a